jgi:alpha-D-xyloside xylohydrolase
MSELIAETNRILWHFDQQTLVIEPWGENSLRVRATCRPELNAHLWALLPADSQPQTDISRGTETLSIRNGNITATVNIKGQLAFYNQRGELILEEFWRQRSTVGIGATEKSQDKIHQRAEDGCPRIQGHSGRQASADRAF